MNRAIVMKGKDNVATLLEPVEANGSVSFTVGDSQTTLKVKGYIPNGHKLAIKDIAAGGQVIKYGEVIGIATQNISVGEHVHVHNVESCRGRGDK